MSDVKEIQSKLKSAGFYTGIVDGIWGNKSKLALDAALLSAKLNQQDDQHLEVVPVVDVILVPETTPVKPVQSKGYKLSNQSLDKLVGVKSHLVKVVKRAIEISEIDFKVFEGVRTLERQKQLLAQKATQTLKSKHITGDAVDLIPIVNGKANHADWEYFYPIAVAMQKAAKELGVEVTWGGCWSVINDKPGDSKQWVSDYVKYRKSLGKSAFIDGPHFQIN